MKTVQILNRMCLRIINSASVWNRKMDEYNERKKKSCLHVLFVDV